MQSSEIRTPSTNSGGQVFKYKLVFVGDQSVGKTSIINRFIYDSFTGSDQPTVGIDFISKTLHLDNKTIRLQLWDTAGQERFRSLIPSYIRDSNAAIIVYDITSAASFQNVNKWIEYVREERGTDVLVVLIGNKIDAAEKRQVTTEEGEAKAKEFEMSFFEVSAKSGVNVPVVFKNLTTQLQGLGDVNQSTMNNQTNVGGTFAVTNTGLNNPNSATPIPGATGCSC